MRKNKVKEMMKAGKPVVNGWLKYQAQFQLK
jgi:hypothetical protein